MIDRGKLVVTSILGIALALAAFAWWWNYQHGRRSHEFWGREQILLIRQARQVELLRLMPSAAEPGDTEAIDFAGHSWTIVERKDVSQAQGLLHARFALNADASFYFDEPVATEPHWQYAARFTRDGRSATVLFDFAQAELGIAEQQRAVRVVPKIVSGWKQFIGRHLTGERSESK